MAIHEITVERLKTFVILGHSNADGYASNITMFEAYGNLFPKEFSYLTPSQENYFRGIYVATSAQPWPGTAGTPVGALPGDVEWLELTTNIPTSPGDNHPHPSPYLFPNNQGGCYPIWFYRCLLGTLADVNGAIPAGTRVGFEIPLAYRWSQHFNQQVGVVKVAFGETKFQRFDRGGTVVYLNPNQATPADAQFQYGSIDITQFNSHAYWTPEDTFDWAPATDRLYKLWYDKMVGAQAALPDGCKMDVRLIVPYFGDNDSMVFTRAALEPTFEKSCREFCRRIRQDCVDNDWTTLPAHQIPIVWPGIFSTYEGPDSSPGWSSVDFCNEALQRIAADDSYFRYVPTTDLSTLEDDGLVSVIGQQATMDSHLGAVGYFDLSDLVYNAFADIENDGADSLTDDEKVSVETVFDRCRVFYNRAQSNTDMTDAHLFIHLNSAIDSILNALGDNVPWLRRRESFTLTADESATNVCTLPKVIGRLLKVESPRNARYPLKWELVGRTSTGSLQIDLCEIASGGSYVCHYLLRPRDVTQLEQMVPLPRQLIEWLTVETCMRFSMSGSNVLQQATLTQLANQLRERSMKELQVQDRGKFDRLYTNRRLPHAGRGRWRGKTTWDRT